MDNECVAPNFTIQNHALIGKPVNDGWYLFLQTCTNGPHVVRWHPPTNTFRFDALAASSESRAVFSKMSGVERCHCEVILQFMRRAPKQRHFFLGHGQTGFMEQGLHLLMETN